MSELSEILDIISQYADFLSRDEIDEMSKIMSALFPSLPDWMEENFYIPELTGPIELYPHQRDSLIEAIRKDEYGNYVYDLVLWSDIKKSAKTTIGGARVLYTAITQPFSKCRIIGNDLDQAKSRMFNAIKDCLRLNPRLVKDYDIRFTDQSRDIVIAGLHSSIQAVPIDPSGEAGGGDDVVAYTELWGFQSQAHVNVWAETTLSPLKRGKSQRWAESYAGFVGKSIVLEGLYIQTVEHGKEIPNPCGYEWYTDPGETMFVLWNTVPRLPWQTQEYYKSERAAIADDASFLRMHRNQWQSSQERFIPSDHYLEQCLYDEIPHPHYGSSIFLAADAGVFRDSYGLVAGTYDRERDIITIFDQTELSTFGAQVEVDLEEAEKITRKLSQQYRVVAWAYDPTQLESTAQRLSKRMSYQGDPIIYNPMNIYRFTQVSKRVVADTSLLDRIRSARLKVRRGSPLAAHLENADAKIVGGKNIRIVKRTERLKIDLAVSLSMLCYIAEHADELKLQAPDATVPAGIAYAPQAGGGTRRIIGMELPSEIGSNLPREIGI